MHNNEPASGWPGECMPSAIKARRPFRLASSPWAAERGGNPQGGYAPPAVPPVRYVAPDCGAQSYPQAVSSSPPSLQGGFPYPTWSAPPTYALQDARLMTGVLPARRSPETLHGTTSFTRPSAPTPPAAFTPPKTSPVSYEEAVRIAWAQPCPGGVPDRRYPNSVDEILPAIRSDAKVQEGMRGFADHSGGSSEAEGCGLLDDASRMATTDGQMDLIPLDQIIPRPVGTMAAGCGAASVERAAASNSGTADGGYFNSATATEFLVVDRYGDGQAFAGGESNDSSEGLSCPPHKVSPIPAAAWYRKLCEIPGCTTQPSYGERGTSKPLFCARHKKDGMVGLKNRPCLYPGCTIRPHYGIPGGRAFYCTSHKKDGMVHLLKETTTRAKLEKESKLMEAGGVLVKRKRCPYGTGSYARRSRAVAVESETVSPGKEKDGDKAVPGSENIEDKTAAGDGEGFLSREAGMVAKGGMGASPVLAVPVAPPSPNPCSSRSGTVPLTDEGLRPPTEMRELGIATLPSTRSPRSQPSPRPTSVTSRKANRTAAGPLPWETTLNGMEPAYDTGTGTIARDEPGRTRESGTSRTSRGGIGRAHGVGASMMTRGDTGRVQDAGTSRMMRGEMRRVRDAGMTRGEMVRTRDVGVCRRARAPSRRAMESLGRAEDEGAQWMTREKREEQARLNEKLKGQRRAAAAAGLKAGEVLEEYHAPSPATSEVNGGLVPWGANSRDGGGKNDGLLWGEATPCDDGSGRKQGGRKCPLGRSGRKANLDETSPRQGINTTQHPRKAANRHLAKDGATPTEASGSCAGALSSYRNGTDTTIMRGLASGASMVTHRDVLKVSRQRRAAGENRRDTQAEQGSGRWDDSRGVRGNSRSGVEAEMPRPGGRNEVAKEAQCEFQSCSKMATFGVNLTVRYCELHRLFGMHEIGAT